MRGGETKRLRAYNERLIISALLASGPMSKAAIARETGLSGQAASVIVNNLLKDRMLIKLKKVRGQVGQPSTPVAPNPQGAYSVGVKIGRRSAEAILVNLAGEVVVSHATHYVAPLPEPTLKAATELASRCLSEVVPDLRDRVVGLGVAIPDDLHMWSTELGLAEGAMDAWRETDVASVLAAETDLPVSIYNDAAAACAAEMIRGEAIHAESALYVYLGTFIGGGVVLGRRLYPGAQLNAGALGSMPMGGVERGKQPAQLIHRASLISLEDALSAAGIDAVSAIEAGGVDAATRYFEDWARSAAADLAQALVTATSIIDFQTIVIDGILNSDWRARFTRLVIAEMERFNLAGLAPAEVTTGSIGAMARVIGAAMMPLRSRFSPDAELLVKGGGGEP